MAVLSPSVKKPLVQMKWWQSYETDRCILLLFQLDFTRGKSLRENLVQLWKKSYGFI